MGEEKNETPLSFLSFRVGQRSCVYVFLVMLVRFKVYFQFLFLGDISLTLSLVTLCLCSHFLNKCPYVIICGVFMLGFPICK
jgi:hypothetical protein